MLRPLASLLIANIKDEQRDHSCCDSVSCVFDSVRLPPDRCEFGPSRLRVRASSEIACLGQLTHLYRRGRGHFGFERGINVLPESALPTTSNKPSQLPGGTLTCEYSVWLFCLPSGFQCLPPNPLPRTPTTRPCSRRAARSATKSITCRNCIQRTVNFSESRAWWRKRSIFKRR